VEGAISRRLMGGRRNESRRFLVNSMNASTVDISLPLKPPTRSSDSVSHPSDLLSGVYLYIWNMVKLVR
jgi:hypothetical protein